MAETVELTVGPLAAGGDALARDADGRVIFVSGALPAERVEVAILKAKKDFATAEVVRVIEASPHRREPPCIHFRNGCGGCQWQHATEDTQRAAKIAIVEESLRRLGHIEVPVRDGGSVDPWAYRTTIRVTGDEHHRPSYRCRGGNELVAVDSCLIAHERISKELAGLEVLDEFQLRVSDTEGSLNSDVQFEEVCGLRFRVSASSFFQSGRQAAVLLAETVDSAVGDALVDGAALLDLYAGVGILGAVAASRRRDVKLTAVESSNVAVRDARKNLAQFNSQVVQTEVMHFRPERHYDLVIADPARPGLGKAVVARLVAMAPSRIVLVSCDPASLARDARLLIDSGYRLASVTAIDLFPQTSHVEAVTVFDRQ